MKNTQDNPAFEISLPTGEVYKIWENGRCTGLPKGSIILNNIPSIRHELVRRIVILKASINTNNNCQVDR